MPNYCNFEMKITGRKSAIKRVIKCLNARYNYIEGKPNHKHFFRIFDVDDELEPIEIRKDIFVKTINGTCAWSVYSCMFSGNNTYYDSVKKEYKDIFMGTTLKDQSRDCEIEVFSEENEIGFKEHYLFRNKIKLIDETKN